MQSQYVAGIFAALEFGQGRLKDNLAGLTAEQLTKVPAGLKNSVAALAVHLAAVEVNMAHRFAGKSVSDALKAEYLLNQPQSPLPQPLAETVDSLVTKLTKARTILQEAVSALKDADLDKEWQAPTGKKHSFRYMLNLLPHHQGLHLGHIQFIKQLNG